MSIPARIYLEQLSLKKKNRYIVLYCQEITLPRWFLFRGDPTGSIRRKRVSLSEDIDNPCGSSLSLLTRGLKRSRPCPVAIRCGMKGVVYTKRVYGESTHAFHFLVVYLRGGAQCHVHLHDLGVACTRLERGWPMWGCDKERPPAKIDR